MDQTQVPEPEIATGPGYPFLYSIYLNCIAWLLRQAVARFTGTGSLFTTHCFVATPGLGEGRVKCSVCIPKESEQSPKLLPLILVLEGGGFILGQPADGERNDRLLSEHVGVPSRPNLHTSANAAPVERRGCIRRLR